jgi:hypothetical protein
MRRGLALLIAVALQAGTSGDARADEKQRCVAASEEGQELRDNGNYRRAREAFTTCAKDTCPQLVRRDCAHWQAELEDTWPSVIVGAKDGKGNDLVDVRVLLDGEPLLTKLDGKPTRVNPGEHVLRCEAEGLPTTETRVVIRAGEKNRVIQVQLGNASVTPPKGEEEHATHTPSSESSGPSETKRTSAIAFGAIALAAFGSEAYFGLTGLSDRSTLMSQPCAQHATCSQSSVDSIRTKFTVADISLGVGLASAALAVYLYVTSSGGGGDAGSARSSDSSPSHSARFDVAPLAGGGAAASFAGRF